MFLLPMVIISVAGLALGGDFEQNIQIDVLVVDLDNGDISKGFVEFLEEIDILDVDMESNEFAARDRVKDQEYGRLIIIPRDFTESTMMGENSEISIIVDPTEDSQNTVLEKIVEGYANGLSTNVVVVKTVAALGIPVYSEEQIFEVVDVANQFAQPLPVQVKTESTSSNLGEFTSFTHYVPGFAVMFVLFTSIGAGSVSLLKEYKREVLRYLNGELAAVPPFPENYFSAEAAAIVAQFVTSCDNALREESDLPEFPEDELAGYVDNTWTDTGKAIVNNWLGLVYQLTNLDRHQQFMSGIDPDDPLALKS